METAQDVFGGGPPLRRFRYARLTMGARTLRLMIAAMAIAWVPAFLMAALQSLVSGDDSLHSFLTDYGMFGRSLLAVPLLILAQAAVAPRLDAILHYFRESGLVRGAEVVRFGEIVRSTSRLRDSSPWPKSLSSAAAVALVRGLLDRTVGAVARLAPRRGGAFPGRLVASSSSACRSCCCFCWDGSGGCVCGCAFCFRSHAWTFCSSRPIRMAREV